MTDTATARRARLLRLLGYLASDPGNARLRGDVFDTALAAGDFDEADRQAALALERDPRDATWRARQARLRMAQGRWGAARAVLEQLAADGHGDDALAYNLAYTDMMEGRFEQAEARLEPIVATRLAALPQALALLVSCRHRRGAPDEAVAAFVPHAAAAGAPALGAASLAALDAGDATHAGAWAERALALDPGQQEALVAAATLRIGARDAAGALALLSHSVAGDGRVLSTTALAQMLAGRLPEARAAYEQAAAAMPGHIGTWLGLGWCAIFTKDLPAARRAIEAALAIDPAFGESHGALAVVEALEGHAPAAEDAIRRARGLDRRGLGAEYARAILEGETLDPERFLQRAGAALAQQQAPGGGSLAELVLAQRRRA
jgi:tetratricopeptide (TPR) repeat protein